MITEAKPQAKFGLTERVWYLRREWASLGIACRCCAGTTHIIGVDGREYPCPRCSGRACCGREPDYQVARVHGPSAIWRIAILGNVTNQAALRTARYRYTATDLCFCDLDECDVFPTHAAARAEADRRNAEGEAREK